MSDQLTAIVDGWKSHFWSADHEIEWVDVERPVTAWLNENTLIAGVIDAIGRDANGKFFFGEWKTANPREKKTWKQVWRKNPQSLTYGVLVDAAPDIWPDCKRFTVRKAFKETVPTFDHAWYSYSAGELRHWRRELLTIAAEIRGYQGDKPWPTNFSHCFQWGVNYGCPFFENGCDKEQWDFVPANALIKGEQPFVQAALDAAPFKRDVIVLSPSRVSTWLGCRERFRKQYIERIELPAGEALTLGGDFHHAIAEHYRNMAALPKAPAYVLGVSNV